MDRENSSQPSDRGVNTSAILAADRLSGTGEMREMDQFRIAADAVPQIVWITDAEGRTQFFNQQWSNYTGAPYEPTTAADVAANFVHPDDAEATMEAFNAARATGTTFRVEHRIRSRHGYYRWFLVRADPYRDPATGEIVRWYGASVDIHDRKLAEEALAKAAARDEFRVRLSDTIRTLEDPDDVKKAAARVLGERLGVNRALYAEVHDADWMVVKGYETGVEPMRDGPYSSEDFGTWIMETYRRGELILFRDTQSEPEFSPAEREAHRSVNVIGALGVPIIKAGELVAILALHTAEPRDWTSEEIDLAKETAERTWAEVNRARSEAALRTMQADTERQRRLYDAILSNTPDLAYVFGLDHRFTYANPGLLEMWGKTWDEAIGKNCLELGYPDWHAAMHGREIDQVAATKKPVRGTVPFAGTFGRRLYDYILVPVIGSDGNVEAVAGTTRDVTDHHQAAARDEYRVKLSDAIRPLRDPEEVKRAATMVLGEHLAANRVFYAEVRGDKWLMAKGFEKDVPPLAEGVYSAEDFGTWFLERYQAGERVVSSDTQTDPRFSEHDRAAHAAIGAIGGAGVPLLKAGELVAILAVNTSTPHEWADDELALIEETAERTWDAVERVRAEAELQEAHAEMERRVRQRTHELAVANEALSAEIEERKILERTRVELIRRIVTTQEEERRRMSRDLHDQLGQQMTVLRLKLSALRAVTGDEGETAQHVKGLQEIANALDDEVSFLSSQMRPTALDDLGLEQALGAYTAEWSRHFGIQLEFHSNLVPGERLDPEVETHLYRIAQEALNNVAKHAAAGHVAVLLEKTFDGVVLVVEDDGLGFTPESPKAAEPGHGLGLLGMRERANLIGGDLEVESEPDRGTTVFFRMKNGKPKA